MAIYIRRRELIAALGGAAVAWPVASRAQQPKGPVIGYLNSISNNAGELAAFRQGLTDLGFIEGQNVTVLY
jgi:putative tryptophan/tyrosine transport system substrate-binding protein